MMDSIDNAFITVDVDGYPYLFVDESSGVATESQRAGPVDVDELMEETEPSEIVEEVDVDTLDVTIMPNSEHHATGTSIWTSPENRQPGGVDPRRARTKPRVSTVLPNRPRIMRPIAQDYLEPSASSTASTRRARTSRRTGFEYLEPLAPPASSRARINTRPGVDVESGTPRRGIPRRGSSRKSYLSSKSEDERSAIHSQIGLARRDALLLGMERTFFAALNNVGILVLAGISLMSIGNFDSGSTIVGACVIGSGIFVAALALCLHWLRISYLPDGEPFPLYQSVLWTGLIAGITVTALVLELIYGFEFPYLDRAAAVKLLNETEQPT